MFFYNSFKNNSRIKTARFLPSRRKFIKNVTVLQVMVLSGTHRRDKKMYKIYSYYGTQKCSLI